MDVPLFPPRTALGDAEASAMAGAIAAHDWSRTALGPKAAWPASAATLVALILAAKQPMFLAWGPERLMIYNDAYAPLLGTKHPGALGRPFFEVWHEAAESLRPLVDRVFAGDADYMHDFHIVLDRGEGMKDAYFTFSYTPVRASEGAVEGLFCACTETTAGVLAESRRLLAEERLRESEDNYRHAVELNPQVPWTARPDGMIDRVSERWAELTGHQALGASWADAMHPDDRPDMRRAWDAAVASGQPYEMEHRVLTRAGQYRWFITRAFPRHDADGRVIRWYGTTEDIHERKLGEIQMRSILATVPDGMVVVDEFGRIHSASPTAERLFGYGPDALVGGTLAVLLPEILGSAGPGRAGSDVVDVTGIGPGRTTMGRRQDGSTVLVDLCLGEMTSGTERLFTCFLRDLTEKREAEDRLREIQAELLHMSRFTALGEMASALAHELNQPLTAISNYLGGCRKLLETAEAPLAGDAAAIFADAIGEATGQALRAGEIIRSLRAFVSRADGRRQATNLGDLVRESCGLALVGSTHLGISLTVAIGADLAVHVDRVQIQQVILNLLRNAIEAMADRPLRTLAITAASVQDGAFKEVVIEDSGGGIDPQIAARLFQPFQTTKPSGMGVGLSICRTIIEAHGGRIQAQSQSGQGTTFRFTLPKFAEERHVP
jgi:PAS domain S-box-containing protein